MNDYIFFWRVNEPNGIFSQWYPSKFTDEHGKIWHTAEQYMMYHKAISFNDIVTAQKIINSPKAKPSYHKYLGRQVVGFKMDSWRKVCENIVLRGNILKFCQNQDLKKALLETGDKIIVEASPLDRLWGIGFDAETAELYLEDWGENLLGKVLMRVREMLVKYNSF